MSGKAVRIFEVEEETTKRGRHRITVKFNGKIVETFTEDTPSRVRRAFLQAGYKSIAWVEGNRIVLKSDKS